MPFPAMHPSSVLFITLDSCRFDTFAAAALPTLKAIGPLHQAFAPSTFTYGSHSAMFVGFTPGRPDVREPYVNSKYGKIFRIKGGGLPGPGGAFAMLEGANIAEGFRNKGFTTLGTAAMGWFNQKSPAGRTLAVGFDRFWYSGNSYSLRRQLEWLGQELASAEAERPDVPRFAFINVGETHVPYYHEGAPWDRQRNPCQPFADDNDAEECRKRQRACAEFVDGQLGPLLAAFASASVVVCGDHGDCWGEDGLWEHGIYHPKILEVPLLFRLNPAAGLQ